jgi:hypothetical protein
MNWPFALLQTHMLALYELAICNITTQMLVFHELAICNITNIFKYSCLNRYLHYTCVLLWNPFSTP